MIKRRHSFVIAVFLGVATSCQSTPPARDQWTVWITTDAPTALVDRGLIEIVDDQGELACADCRRQVGLPTDASGWPISFGLVPPPNPSAKALHIRTRLYRAQRSGVDGFPLSATALDLVGTLPLPHGNTDVAMAVHAECIGVQASPVGHQSCVGPTRELAAEPTLPLGRPDPTFVPGSWSRSVHHLCIGTVPDGMVCHPGGFMVLGDAVAPSAIQTPPRPERFVTLPAFALDTHEVSVGAVRALVQAKLLTSEPTKRDPVSGNANAACSYLGATNDANDSLPINCISRSQATQICAVLNRRLPTEVEWQWAAGNLERSTYYPWGDTGDPCDHADVGLGRQAYEGNLFESFECRARAGHDTLPPGLPAFANELDVTDLGVYGLGGGVSEWTSNYLATYDNACWSPDEPFLDNPTCADGTLVTICGSSWADAPGTLSRVERQGAKATLVAPATGVRCALSMDQ